MNEDPVHPIEISVPESLSLTVQSNHPTSTSTTVPPQHNGITESSNVKATEPAEDEIDRHLWGLKLYLVVAGLMLVGFLISLNGSFVATVYQPLLSYFADCILWSPWKASPRITTDFHSIEDIGWYGSAYLVANCAVQPLTGKTYGLFPLKYTFLSFLGVFELGSLLCATADGSTMFIVGRAIAGMGSAGLLNGCFNTLTAVTPLEKRPKLVGLIFSISTIGSVIGPLVGGALTEAISWRLCFYLNLPLGAITGLLQLLIHSPAKENPQTAKKNIWEAIQQLDIIGFITFAPAVVMFLIAMEWGGTTYMWSSPPVLGLSCGSLVAFAAFIVGQYYEGDSAMIPFGIISRRVVYCGFLTVMFQLGGLYVLSYYTPVWFQIVKGATPLLSGLYVLPTVISQIISAGISGMLVTKIGYYLPWAIFGSVLTSIGSGLMSTYTPCTNPGLWIGFQILTGCGRGMALHQLKPVTALQTVMPAEQVAQATALMMFANFFGGSLFVSIGKTVLLNRLVPALQEFSPTLNAHDLLIAGASGVRDAVSEAELPGVLLAFNQALMQTFFLAAGASAVGFFFSWGLGWRSVKKKKATEVEEL